MIMADPLFRMYPTIVGDSYFIASCVSYMHIFHNMWAPAATGHALL